MVNRQAAMSMTLGHLQFQSPVVSLCNTTYESRHGS